MRILLIKILLPFFVLVALAGCSAADSGTPADTTTIKQLKISATGSTAIIDESESYDLKISGDNNTVTISKFNDINYFKISGNNNIVTFDGLNDTNTFEISGNDNSIFAPASVTTSVSITKDSGSGNSLTLQ